MSMKRRLGQLERKIARSRPRYSLFLDPRPIVGGPQTPDRMRANIAWMRERIELCHKFEPEAAPCWESCLRRSERELARLLGQPLPPPRDWLDEMLDEVYAAAERSTVQGEINR